MMGPGASGAHAMVALPTRFSKGQSRIGYGFCGDVFAAEDAEDDDRVVAVKVLRKCVFVEHSLPFPPAEIAILSSLEHGNVVQLLDVVFEPDRILLIQEYLGGGDLFSCMEESGVFSEFLARCCFSDLLAAVSYLHANGVVHRDLKSENCALDVNGTVKVIDFGLAARFVPGELLTEYCGSPDYSAPEVLREVPYEGPPIDVWALGVILYDMVLGRLPFSPDTTSFVLGEDALCSDASNELLALLQHLLHEDPKGRATTRQIAKSPWMHLPTSLSPGADMELISTSGSTASPMSLSSDSPLRRRASIEKAHAVKVEMGFEEMSSTRQALSDMLKDF